MKFENIVKKLIKCNMTISTMESCTGGGIVNAITNVEGSSEVIKFSAVTYSNEFKIKMGVSSKTIDKYTVYSMEVADEMSKAICEFTSSDFGIGVTGKLNRVDKSNPYGSNNVVFISIYDKKCNKYHNSVVEALKDTRDINKELIIDRVINMLNSILE